MTAVVDRHQVLDCIANAFAHRAPPMVLFDSDQLSDFEHAEVMAFDQLPWQSIGFSLIERNADAVFWFAPEAFCYYLPGFLSAGLKENRTDSNAYDALIGMLDRIPEPAYWDDFFRPRWTRLLPNEIDAVSAWAAWLEHVEPDLAGGDVAKRVRDTLTFIRWTVEDPDKAKPPLLDHKRM